MVAAASAGPTEYTRIQSTAMNVSDFALDKLSMEKPASRIAS